MTGVPRPYALLAELTHRCPLHCPYCSNPIELAKRESELSTDDWQRVLREASAMGVLQVGFSGGEPLLRDDLEKLVETARSTRMYTNLITSAVGLTKSRIEKLKSAGLDSVQISIQSDEEVLADRIAGTKAQQLKLQASQEVREAGLPLTINVVLHRANIDRIQQIIALAEQLQAQRLELANTQYYGWANLNHSSLLPTRSQIECADKIASEAQVRLVGKMEILFVLPDYFSRRPKPCMHGWGSRHLIVNPIGDVLPCPTANHIPGLRFENVREKSLAWIWSSSKSFNEFRGADWLPEPCQSCEMKEKDFGGCRCQAALLTGDARATDPACELSPHREKLTQLVVAHASEHVDWTQVTYRSNPRS